MSIEATITKVIVEQLGVNESDVHLDTHFVDDLGADSLDMVELVMAMEEEFEVEIADEDAEGLTTVEKVVNYVKENQ